MSATQLADRIVADATEFFVAHRVLKGEVYSDEEREGVGVYVLTTLTYLILQARTLGIEDDLDRVLVQIAGRKRR